MSTRDGITNFSKSIMNFTFDKKFANFNELYDGNEQQNNYAMVITVSK